MKKTFKQTLAVMVGLIGLTVSTSTMAQYHPYGGYHRGYGYHHSSGRAGAFVGGLIVGGVVGGIIYNATAPRPIYYDRPAVVPYWTVTYVQTYDPGCNCYITTRAYQDQFGNIRSYP